MPVSIDDADAAAVLERFDGLLLMGAATSTPRSTDRSGATRSTASSRIGTASSSRSHAALDRRVPTLAICRGHQVLNVALGGSLDQHITDCDGVLPHGKPGVPGGSTVHDIEIDPDPGWRPRWASRTRVVLVAPPSGGRAHRRRAAGAGPPDGVIEGIELEGDAWIVGAQWHPEDTRRRQPGPAAAVRRVRASGRRDHAVNRRRLVTLAGERADERLGAVERGDPPG